MSIKGKLLLSFLSLVVVILVGMVLSGLRLRELNRAGQTLATVGTAELLAITEIQRTALTAQLRTEEILTGGGGNAESVLLLYDQAIGRAEQLLADSAAAAGETGEAASDASATSNAAGADRGDAGPAGAATSSGAARGSLQQALGQLERLRSIARRNLERYAEQGSVSSVNRQEFYQWNDVFRNAIEQTLSAGRDNINRLSANIAATYRQGLVVMAVTTALGITVALVISFLFSSRLAGRMRRIVTVTESAAEGDFTDSVDMRSKDELGKVGDAMNALAESLSGIISSVQATGHRVAESSTDLSTNADETAAAVNQIKANVDGIRRLAENQASSAEQLADSLDRITEGINTLTERIEQQSASVTESSASIEQMVANIQSVTQNVERSKSYLAELVQSAIDGHDVLSAANQEVQEMTQQSETMLEANRVISTIAAQTNLLAMNAAIEAAHAGEYGHGFAVVADEIRTLAENASNQSKQVDGQLKALKASIDRVSVSSQRSLDSFTDVRDKISDVNELEAEVENSMQEQSAGSSQVLEALSQISSITEEVKKGAEEMRASSTSVQAQTKSLVQTSEEVRQSVSEIVNGTSEIGTAVTHVSEISNVNRQLATELDESLSRFRVRELHEAERESGSDGTAERQTV